MMVLYSPQLNEIDNLTYQFDGDKITATFNGQTDVFDFTSVPQGQVSSITSTLPINPVLSAQRDSNNVLHVKLLNFIGANASQTDMFPKEVSV